LSAVNLYEHTVQVKQARVVVFVCFMLFFFAFLQMVAVNNQKRYRVSFYAAYAHLALSTLLLLSQLGIQYYISQREYKEDS